MIKVENLKKKYGKKLVLDIGKLEFKEGESVGVFGANGSGKSTLIKCLTGLLPYEGKVYIEGKDISKDPSPLRNVGILVEEPALYKTMTGRQNIECFCEDTSNLDKYAEILDVKDLLDKKARSYSLGMKQKMGILLACVKGKKAVILDEPFNCLDIISIEKAIDLIVECQSNGATVILTSHQLELSQKAISKYYLIKDTKIYDFIQQDESVKIYSVEFNDQDNAKLAYEYLKEKSVDCEYKDYTVKIRLTDGDVYSLIGDAGQLKNVKKIEDVSNSVKEAYIAMEEDK